MLLLDFKRKKLTFLAYFNKQIAVSYQSLELLQEHGIAATDIAKLQAAGYHTVESVRRHVIHCRNVFWLLYIGSLP